MGKSDFLPSSSMLRVLSEQSGTKPRHPSLPDRHRGLLLLQEALHTPEGATGCACVPLGVPLGMGACKGTDATGRPRQPQRRPSKSPRCTRRSTEDILKVRDPTRTIETLDFQYGKAKFRVIDVGGQRMERPKWNLTGEITAVIFVCALTEYNQVHTERHTPPQCTLPCGLQYTGNARAVHAQCTRSAAERARCPAERALLLLFLVCLQVLREDIKQNRLKEII